MLQNRNPYAKAASAAGYNNRPQPGNPTYTEAWALIEAARRMAAAIEFGDDGSVKGRNKMREALQLNWRLWTIFQSNLTVGEHDVPEDVRTNILTLAKFIDKHTADAMQDPSPQRIATLIDINRNIGSGLLESIQNTAEHQAAPAPRQDDATRPEAIDVSG
jgi:flagellar protein FlaF